MDNSKILIYDGSFNGFLTAIYMAFDNKITVTDIQKNSISQNGLFSETQTIFTQMDKAKRVWNGIQAKSNTAVKNVYFAFLSEYEGIEQLLYRYIKKLFASAHTELLDTSDSIGSKITHLAKNVGRLKERMESVIGFQLTEDGVYFASICPDFDVLPLISKHFRSRFSDQAWVIFDRKRKYGLYYNLHHVELISLDLESIVEEEFLAQQIFVPRESESSSLLDGYIEKLTILSHINSKLHAANMGERRWAQMGGKKAVS